MADWTWKQAVADEVVSIVNERKDARFTIKDLYSREDIFRGRFPRNRHIREKIRQILQRLRDTGLILFLGDGSYELNLEFDDLDREPAMKTEENGIPSTREVIRHVRLRNTLLAGFVKRRYEFCCQICMATVQLVHTHYAEAHHIHPLGSPHFGRDVEGNILVLCPNHHVMLDRGAVLIDPQSLFVEHIHQAFEPCELYVASWHDLDLHALAYYSQHIYGK